MRDYIWHKYQHTIETGLKRLKKTESSGTINQTRFESNKTSLTKSNGNLKSAKKKKFNQIKLCNNAQVHCIVKGKRS